MKILIAEDDENSRVYLERALTSQKYIVESAGNGAQAFEKALLSPPDMIISDILMPEMNGFDLCRKIKTNEQLAHIPFIFYSATFIDNRDEELAMSLGASRFIVKPVEMQEFFKIINEVIEEHKEKKLPVPAGTKAKPDKIEEMYSERITLKLDKKVAQLQKEIRERKQMEVELKKYHEHLEELVKERTEELIKKNEELERFNKLFVGRELRMIELKKTIHELEMKIAELEAKIAEIFPE